MASVDDLFAGVEFFEEVTILHAQGTRRRKGRNRCEVRSWHASGKIHAFHHLVERMDRAPFSRRAAYLIRWTPVTTQLFPNIDMTVLRASGDDSA